MDSTDLDMDEVRSALLTLKAEMNARIDRIHEQARSPLDADSGEQAAQLGNVEVVSALETEAVDEIAQIDAALRRIEDGHYGFCVTCGEPINEARLKARPASAECLDCADLPSLN